MHPARRDVRQGDEDALAPGDGGMRQREPRGRQDDAAKPKKVYVQSPRAVGLAVTSAKLPLDALAECQQKGRRNVRRTQ